MHAVFPRLIERMFGPRSHARIAPDFDPNTFMNSWRLPDTAWDYENAYRLVPEIAFCVGMLQDAVASTPLRFYVPGREGKKNYLEPEPGNVAGLFATANTEDTGRDLMSGIVGSRALFGTAYMFIDQTTVGPQLWLLNPLAVEILKGPGRSVRGYKVRSGGKFIEYPREQIIRFPRFDPRFGLQPVSPLEPLVQQYEGIYDASQWLRLFYQKGGLVATYFATDGSVDPSIRRRIARQINRLTQGLKNAWNTIVLPNGLKPQRIGLTLEEMRLEQMDDVMVRKIFRAFHVPPSYGGLKDDGSGMNSDTVRAAGRQWHRLGRVPECSSIQATINERFLAGVLGTDIRCEFDFSALPEVQEDELDEIVKWVEACKRPFMTPDEVRAKRRLEPLGGMAGVLLIPAGMMTEAEMDLREDPPDDTDDDPGAEDSPAAAKPRRLLLGPNTHNRERRRAQRVRADQKLRRHEQRMRKGFLRVFGRQERRVLARLTDQSEGRVNGASAAMLRAINLDDLLRDDPGDERIIRRIVRLIVELQGNDETSDLAKQLGIELAFDVAARDVQRFIRSKAAQAITETSETTRERLRVTIGEGVAASEGIDQLTARVHDTYDGRRGNAAMIARTESASAYNFATLESHVQSEVVEGEEWMSAQDSAVRDTHAEADGQVIGIGQSFMVGGEMLRYPGDPAASPDNRIGCRCVLVPVIKLEARATLPASIARRMGQSAEEWLATSRA